MVCKGEKQGKIRTSLLLSSSLFWVYLTTVTQVLALLGRGSRVERGAVNISLQCAVNISLHGAVNISLQCAVNISLHAAVNISLHAAVNISLHGAISISLQGC